MGNNLKLCREPLRFDAELTLGVHSNVAGDEFGYKDGHAWISVRTRTNVTYLGLWPDGHPRVIEKSPDCSDLRIDMEAGASAQVSRYYRLDRSQVAKLNDIVNRPAVWGYTHNCTNWAVKVLQEVIGVKWNAVDYALFSTPRELGRMLNMIEKHYPTAADRPHLGPPVEFFDQSELKAAY